MGIGGSIFLIALGAILAFAVEANLGWLDINVVGWVLMIAGIAGLVLTMWFWQNRRRTTTVVQPAERVVPVQTERIEERREVRRPGGRLYE
jgi:Flp pilus assembly protein TadB